MDEQTRTVERFRRQAAACAQLGSPLYGHLLARCADDVEAGGPAWEVLRGRTDPPGSVPSLRLAGAVHRLVLQGRARELAAYYPSAGGTRAGDAWPAFRTVLEAHRDELRELVMRPVQTNEVGRCAALAPGFLLVARESGLPLRLLELGASAGLNLRWDRYRYDGWGDPSSPVEIEGAPPLSGDVAIAERRGCDRQPVDPTSEEGRLTLRSYVWPDQVERRRRLDGALAVAAEVAAPVDEAGAADWLAARLADGPPDVATVVFHSIVMQYVPEDERSRIDELLAAAPRPAARLELESAGPEAELRLTLWPGGERRILARSGYHGPPVRWLAA